MYGGVMCPNIFLLPYQLVALEPMSSISEVSPVDSVEDNYRIAQGDSQVQTKE